jgi:hypothetical protein
VSIWPCKGLRCSGMGEVSASDGAGCIEHAKDSNEGDEGRSGGVEE